MGDPHGLEELSLALPANALHELKHGTMVAFSDFDASPTKAWMLEHRDDASVRPLIGLAFGKRPREEMYDLQQVAERCQHHYMCLQLSPLSITFTGSRLHAQRSIFKRLH